jgi:hypothetical protein
MSYFEYVIEVPVDDKVEDKTKELLSVINNVGARPFNLSNYVDRDNGNETKSRVFTIIAYSNINHLMAQLFYGYATKVCCYFKTPVHVW